MNNAAIIGRHLRQNNVGYRGSVYGPSQASQANSRKKQKGLAAIRNKVSLSCIWSGVKALSGGIILFSGGMAMMVVSFFAEPLSTKFIKLENGTVITEKDSDLKFHLINIGYVGPVIMGIGGIAIVAAIVLAFDVKEPVGSKIVPMKEDQLTGVDRLVKEKAREEKTREETQFNAKQFWYEKGKTVITGALMVPEVSPVVIIQPNRLPQLTQYDMKISGQKY